jgi:hypothetical protein
MRIFRIKIAPVFNMNFMQRRHHRLHFFKIIDRQFPYHNTSKKAAAQNFPVRRQLCKKYIFTTAFERHANKPKWHTQANEA